MFVLQMNFSKSVLRFMRYSFPLQSVAFALNTASLSFRSVVPIVDVFAIMLNGRFLEFILFL